MLLIMNTGADIENFNVTRHCADVSFSETPTQLAGGCSDLELGNARV